VPTFIPHRTSIFKQRLSIEIPYRQLMTTAEVEVRAMEFEFPGLRLLALEIETEQCRPFRNV